MSMKRCFTILLIGFLMEPMPAQAASYKLTVYYDFQIALAFPEPDWFVEDLDNGEQTCESILTVASIRGYDPENLDPLLGNTNYKVKNESGRVIASGKFNPKISRPGGQGSGTCRAEVTLSFPKAKFYDVQTSDGDTLISGFPFKNFKKNRAKVNIFDWN
jgi:hypothetical protein